MMGAYENILGEELAERARVAAFKNRVPVSKLIRHAIECYLEAEAKRNGRNRKRRKGQR